MDKYLKENLPTYIVTTIIIVILSSLISIAAFFLKKEADYTSKVEIIAKQKCYPYQLIVRKETLEQDNEWLIICATQDDPPNNLKSFKEIILP